ncbi:hypothetical protein EDF19_2438 [Curtobacterium sp. PhB115]|nr:hypothetical protein EDF19_2438 [Curtobacterium sp. PhB115]
MGGGVALVWRAWRACGARAGAPRRQLRMSFVAKRLYARAPNTTT